MFNGIFFVLKKSYQFTPISNCLLGLVFGVTYIAGAVSAGPLTRWLTSRGVSARALLAWLMVMAALLNGLPVLAWYGFSVEARPSTAWMMWVFSALYSALSGIMWPIVESYLTGGRTNAQVRKATGIFNVTWSTALVASLLVLARFNEDHKIAAFGLVAVTHIGCLAFLLYFPKQPGAHEHVAERNTPTVYTQLLSVHRVLLPMTYLVMYALGPLQPQIMSSIGIADNMQETAGATWLAARVITFLTLGLWQSWHGRWFTPVIGMTLLITGFAACVLAPLLGATPTAIATFLAGLTAFGLGAATIYSAALYYALEVGSAQVDAGGTHEAMIGLGYTIGPICSLLPLAAVSAGMISKDAGNPATLALTGALVAIGLIHAVRTKNKRLSLASCRQDPSP